MEIRFGKTRIVLPFFLPNQYFPSVTLEVANEIGTPLSRQPPVAANSFGKKFLAISLLFGRF
jgi:hypothetical protein